MNVERKCRALRNNLGYAKSYLDKINELIRTDHWIAKFKPDWLEAERRKTQRKIEDIKQQLAQMIETRE